MNEVKLLCRNTQRGFKGQQPLEKRKNVFSFGAKHITTMSEAKLLCNSIIVVIYRFFTTMSVAKLLCADALAKVEKSITFLYVKNPISKKLKPYPNVNKKPQQPQGSQTPIQRA